MLKNRLILLAAFLFTVVCAYGQDVHYNYDRGVNFSSYKTYQWIDLPEAVSDQLVDRDIKRAVDEQLAQKGLTKVEKGADLYVGYRTLINLEKGVDLSALGTRGGPGGWGGFDNGTVTGQTSTIPVGMLFVDLYDAGKKQLIWRGDANNPIDLKKDPNRNYKTCKRQWPSFSRIIRLRANKWRIIRGLGEIAIMMRTLGIAFVLSLVS